VAVKGKRRLAAVMVAGSVALLLLWRAAPRLVEALPGQIRGRLPETVLLLVTTPLPTALPAPADAPQLPLARIALATPTILPPTPLPTVPPTWTTSPVMTSVSATILPTATATATVVPLPAAARVDGVPIIPQKYNNCGPANLTLVLRHFGLEADQLALGSALKPNYDDRNVSPAELAFYVSEQTELRAAVYHGGDLVLLKRLLAAGLPVIIEKSLDHGTQGWMGHYVTVVSYDDAAGEMAYMDTFLGPWDGTGRASTYADLETQWSHFNFVLVVVYPPERHDEVTALLGPGYLDAERMWQEAAWRAQTTAAATPENAYAWFNLGASLTHLAELPGNEAFYIQAAAAFDRARQIGLPWRMLWYQFEPYVAYLAAGRPDDVLTLSAAILSDGGGQDVEESYLYRGQALMARGDAEGAQAAFAEAQRLNPGSQLVQQIVAPFNGG
jgi:tetratricopeptide (TPR) repeat protein